jgi:3'(2'), 5'-bisphosphate nucleotidase
MTEASPEYLLLTVHAAFEAGLAIMEVYRKKIFKTELKKDLSPVTEADYAAHRIIAGRLEPTAFPILSEEGKEVPYQIRKQWKKFWLVDPLDGTKEFIRRNDEFTVNIALIFEQAPVMGVIYAPCRDILYFASDQTGAYRIIEYSRKDREIQSGEDLMRQAEKLPLKIPRQAYTSIASRSHRNEQTDLFIRRLQKEHPGLKLVSTGSSLKFCLMAEGKADIYPRFGPTMEWDTAAGHAIARAAGCSVKLHEREQSLQYNKEVLTNPGFIVNRTP